MIVDDLLAYLNTLGIGVYAPGGTPNQNMFVNGWPLEGGDDAIALIETSGADPLHVHDRPEPSYTRPTLQVLTRSKDYVTARAKCWDVYNAFAKLCNQAVGSSAVLEVRPRQTPFPIGGDENEREQFSCNFEFLLAGTAQ